MDLDPLPINSDVQLDEHLDPVQAAQEEPLPTCWPQDLQRARAAVLFSNGNRKSDEARNQTLDAGGVSLAVFYILLLLFKFYIGSGLTGRHIWRSTDPQSRPAPRLPPRNTQSPSWSPQSISGSLVPPLEEWKLRRQENRTSVLNHFCLYLAAQTENDNYTKAEPTFPFKIPNVSSSRGGAERQVKSQQPDESLTCHRLVWKTRTLCRPTCIPGQATVRNRRQPAERLVFSCFFSFPTFSLDMTAMAQRGCAPVGQR